jgi:class 3 adenylate cyclase
MGSLPSGILAVLMTDVEASARAWNEAPGATDAAVTALDADLRDIVAEHQGSVVKARGEGDSHFAVFAEASRAVAAAASMQRRADARLSVRAAVLLGELRPRGDDYLGVVVNHCARIRSVAHGGQVVATRSVVDVAMTQLPQDLTFRTLGLHSRPRPPRPHRALPAVRAWASPLVPAAADERVSNDGDDGRRLRR